jgi:putative endopeptidase
MNPQTVNAYYDPVMSEIVFPAGILQPPFFSNTMEENLGAIGCVIGHEMTHGFDDEGRKYNSKGELKDWWTSDDTKKFEERAADVVDHYSSQTVVGEHVNGKLTLGENIADIGGLRLALRTLRKHYGESITRDHYVRFFNAFAIMWRMNVRDEFQKMLLTVDPHSPCVCRINATLAHVQEFYDTYEVTESDRMYLPPEKRMRIW